MEQEVLFTYDTNVLGGHYLGRLSKVEYAPEVDGAKKYVEKFLYSPGGLTLQKQWDVRKAITGGAATGSLTAEWDYNEVGTLLEVTYPGGVSYQQELDWMGRPQHLYRDGTELEVEFANWNAAGQLTAMWRQSQHTSTNKYNEQFYYNARGQLTKQKSASQWWEDPNVEVEYEFPETANAGRIAKRRDVITGEEVAYSYDSLNRLVSAATTAGSSETWGLAFGFDGFGNKVSQSVTKGSGPVWSQTVSTATNRVDAYSYDLNGNVTAMTGKTMVWDVLNRMESVVVSGGTESYDYAPSGLKVRWERVEGSATTERYVFYGAGGERMEEFAANVNGSVLQFASTGRDVRFAGRLIYQKGEQVFTDRLGSVVLRRESGSWKRLSSYPYGEVKGAAPAGDRTGFATYERSGLTGLDYARQRWYSGSGGAFLSADPYVASAGAGDPGSWNRYAYVQGDPVNWGDPEGLEKCGDVELLGFPGIANGTTVADILSGTTDISAFSQTLFTETRIATDAQAGVERAAVAATIMNRWQFVNGNFTLHNGPVRSGRTSKPRVVPDWGESDDTLTSIVFAPGQFEPWVGEWKLGAAPQTRLNSALASDDHSAECRSLGLSILVAAEHWSDRSTRQLYQTGGLVFTSFSAGKGGQAPTKSSYEKWIGSAGSRNVFSGVPFSYIEEFADSPSEPIRRGGGSGRRPVGGGR